MGKDAIFADALRQLRAGKEPMPWLKRQELAQMLGRSLQAGEQQESAVSLAYLLAADPKWEVRKEVANCLSALPADVEVRLIAQLSTDTNAFVRKSVERAIELRRQKRRAQDKKKRDLNQAQSEFEAFTKKYGAREARDARRVVIRLFEMMSRTTAHELLGRMTSLKEDTKNLLECAKANKMDRRHFEETLSGIAERLGFLGPLRNNM